MPGVAIGVDRWRRHHEVSILVAAGGMGWYFGSQPRAKVSMMIMWLPQYGHGRAVRGEQRQADRLARALWTGMRRWLSQIFFRQARVYQGPAAACRRW